MGESCQNCRFWLYRDTRMQQMLQAVQDADKTAVTHITHENAGYCRRYPPSHFTDKPGPKTQAHEWCGEWAATSPSAQEKTGD